MGDIISIGQRPQNISVGGETATNLQTSELTSSAAKTAPLMSSEALKVTSGASTDLEKLVAQLKNENDDTRQSVAQRRIAILKTVLNTMATRITAVQMANLIQLENLDLELSDVKGKISGMEVEKAQAEFRSAELDAKIQALEKAVEQAIEDGETHREQVDELKRQKKAEDEKIRDLTNAIESAKGKVTSLNGKIADCTAAIGAATLSEVAEAVKAAAGDVKPQEDRESSADRDKAEKKAVELNPANIIREALDKIDADIIKTIEKERVETV